LWVVEWWVVWGRRNKKLRGRKKNLRRGRKKNLRRGQAGKKTQVR
jgi:hypothetical protein